jgi:hypothetical protein
VLWRFRQVPAAAEASLIEGLRKIYGDRPETAQIRLFRVSPEAPADYLGLVELRSAGGAPDVALLGDVGRHVDLINTYVPYTRQAPGAFPKPR